MTTHIDKNVINKEYKTATLKLEELLSITLHNMKIEYKNDEVNRLQAIKSFNIINAFCKQNQLSIIDSANIKYGLVGEGFIQAVEDRLEFLLINEYDENLNDLFISNNKMNDAEHDAIQNMINELRNKINSDKQLEDEHKERILKKLNEMQAQLDKKISDGEIIKGKALSIINILSFGRKEVITPILRDTTELIKAVNKIENRYSGLSNNNEQIPYSNFLEIDEIIDDEIIDGEIIE